MWANWKLQIQHFKLMFIEYVSKCKHLWECHNVSLITILSLRVSYHYTITAWVVALKRASKLLDDVRWKLARTASRGPEKGSWILDAVEVGWNGESFARDVRRVGNVPVYWLLSCRIVSILGWGLQRVEPGRCWLAPVVVEERSCDWLSAESQRISHIATDGQSVGLFWYWAPSGAHDQIFIYLFNLVKVTVLSMGGALSDERSGLSHVSQSSVLGSCQWLSAERERERERVDPGVRILWPKE
jgi:hypothetical protein